MADFCSDNDGACRDCVRDLALQVGFCYSRVLLDGCISLARTAVFGLARCSDEGSFRSHTSIHFNIKRVLLSTICLLGAAVCAVGVYLSWWWPEEWQAGLVFILFGLLVLAPVTLREIQLRRKAFARS